MNEADEQGNLPIHLALIEDHADVAELLLAYDSDGLASNKDGLQPIHIACERNQTKIVQVNTILPVPFILPNCITESV